MPKDLVEALALLCALVGDAAVGLAILLSFDCLPRISEGRGCALAMSSTTDSKLIRSAEALLYTCALRRLVFVKLCKSKTRRLQR